MSVQKNIVGILANVFMRAAGNYKLLLIAQWFRAMKL